MYHSQPQRLLKPGADFHKSFIIAGMKRVLDTFTARPVMYISLVAVMLTAGCASPAQRDISSRTDDSGQTRWDRAVAQITAAINLNPLFALVYNFDGLSHYYAGNYLEAIEDFTRAIETDPGLARAYYNRGLIYDRQGEYNRALADYTMVIELDPRNALAYYNRAFIYFSLGRHDKFKEDFQMAQELIRLARTAQ